MSIGLFENDMLGEDLMSRMTSDYRQAKIELVKLVSGLTSIYSSGSLVPFTAGAERRTTISTHYENYPHRRSLAPEHGIISSDL